MKYRATLAFVALLLGYAVATTAESLAQEAAEESQVQTALELLPTPFTAEQIRDEWVEGLRLVLRSRTPGGEAWERWTVIASDAEGADIEFVPVDAEGKATGEARQERSTWAELRDHASYPTGAADREQAIRDTALGQLDGWLYKVRDDASASETEIFFATELPGAPIEMTMTKDGTVIMELAQVERQKPAD